MSDLLDAEKPNTPARIEFYTRKTPDKRVSD